MKPSEQRQFERVAVDLPVEERAEGFRGEASAVDLGALGMRYVKPLSAPRAPGQQVTLTFKLPDAARAISVQGFIVEERVRGRKRFTSVTFSYQSDEDARAVCSFLERAGN